MKLFKKTWKSAALLLLLATALIVTRNALSGDAYSTLKSNLTLFGAIYNEVNQRYVDKVDPEKFLKAGVDGMLNTLDPYTAYMEKEDKYDLDVLTHGNYQGVGIILNYRNKVVTVADPPIPGTPAERAGIRAGDKIILVDGVATSKLGYEETAKSIRGPAGTMVKLGIEREGEEKLLEFALVREKITLEDIRYSGMIRDGVGYILLTKFSKNAGEEMGRAVERLNQQGMKSLILDLRGNPGGMLEAAVDVAELFLPKGTLVVSTRGRNPQAVQKFNSKRDPLFGGNPLVILVNGGSASASEIVAGAIQDHDRGVIMGDTTFGKGLVQTVVPLNANAVLKITTMKYFTPAGRCIQSRSYSNWSDSTLAEKNEDFKTDKGRSVSAGGGIIPDLIVKYPETTDIVLDLRRKSLDFNYAVHYTSLHPAPAGDFQVTDEILDQFKAYLKEKKYLYEHPIEKRLEELKQESVSGGYDTSLLMDIDRLQKGLAKAKDEMLDRSAEDIRKILSMEIASKYYGVQRETQIALEYDPGVQKALEILADKDHYSMVLKSEK